MQPYCAGGFCGSSTVLEEVQQMLPAVACFGVGRRVQLGIVPVYAAEQAQPSLAAN